MTYIAVQARFVLAGCYVAFGKWIQIIIDDWLDTCPALLFMFLFAALIVRWSIRMQFAWIDSMKSSLLYRLSFKGLGEPITFVAFGPLATSAFYLAHVQHQTLLMLLLRHCCFCHSCITTVCIIAFSSTQLLLEKMKGKCSGLSSRSVLK